MFSQDPNRHLGEVPLEVSGLRGGQGKAPYYKPSFMAMAMAEINALHPGLSVVFAGNRKLAQEWTLRFFGAVQAHRLDEPHPKVKEVLQRVTGAAWIKSQIWPGRLPGPATEGRTVMGTRLDRRGFLVAGAAALGAAASMNVMGGVAAGAQAEKGGKSVKGAKAVEQYEVYALKYAGPFTSKLAMVLWMEGWDQEIERNYYFWAVRSKTGDTTLVDTGTGPTEGARRKLKNYVNPVEAVARLKINPEQVSKVVITHIHFDHVGGMEVFPKAFPKARFYVQKKEFDFWVKNPVAKRKPFQGITDSLANKALADLEGSRRLVLVDGDRPIAPGLELLLAPGHTVGLQAVMVNTAKGRVILASDCAHIHRSFKEDIPSCLITDMVAWLKSYDKLRGKTSLDLIFPGHDVMMLNDFPKVAEEVTRLA